MNGKQEIIDFLIDNDELVRDIIRKTSEQIKNVPVEYQEEARNQKVDEVRRQVIDEVSKSLGLTTGDICEIVNEEMIKRVMEVT